MSEKRFIVTGGAGFIGSAVVRMLVNEMDAQVLSIDKLTYAGHEANLRDLSAPERHRLEKVDIVDRQAIQAIIESFKPTAIMHLAAESHVDRSITGPAAFVETNILGTHVLLEEASAYWNGLAGEEKSAFRFLHVSTDEVFGSLGESGRFSESSQYKPNSPYSASKAAADHLVRAWNRTYGLPIIISNCSNNYGPYQFPEKLIPLMTLNALSGKPLPVYGDGRQVRDWLYVDDHARALLALVEQGRPGEVYCVGGDCEMVNLDLVTTITSILDEMFPDSPHRPHGDLIRHVKDRPGHDRRYAIDSGKINGELGWTPRESIASGLRKTITWYVENGAWCDEVTRDAKAKLGDMDMDRTDDAGPTWESQPTNQTAKA